MAVASCSGSGAVIVRNGWRLIVHAVNNEKQ
jgi:nitrogen fixation protein